MLNHITIMGRLTRDPELRRTGSGIAVASFTVAVDRDFSGKDGGDKETDYIDCVAWRQTGEFVSKYFTKGRMIVVSGRLQIRAWTDKEGNKRRTAEVVADNCYFGDSKKPGETENQSANNGNQYGGGYSAPGYNGGYNAPANNGAYNAPGYSGGNPAGSQTAPQQPGYAIGSDFAAGNIPQSTASEFAMLDDDDAQLPF